MHPDQFERYTICRCIQINLIGNLIGTYECCVGMLVLLVLSVSSLDACVCTEQQLGIQLSADLGSIDIDEGLVEEWVHGLPRSAALQGNVYGHVMVALATGLMYTHCQRRIFGGLQKWFGPVQTSLDLYLEIQIDH